MGHVWVDQIEIILLHFWYSIGVTEIEFGIILMPVRSIWNVLYFEKMGVSQLAVRKLRLPATKDLLTYHSSISLWFLGRYTAEFLENYYV